MGIGKKTSAALTAALLMTGAMGANAADLGGTCCADLEERVAELEAMTARKGNRKVSVTLSGQVSRSILWVNTAGVDDHGMIDNLNSPSRFTIAGEAKINPDFSAGYLIEIAVGSPDDALLAGSDHLTVRHNALWVGSSLGKVWLGHTGTATDGIVEINLANVNVVALPLASWVGFDGPRTQVLKVETASMAGFTASASWNDSVISSANPWDAALRYAGEFSGIRVAGGVGYADDDLGATRVSGSASIMHVGTGLFATGQAGRVDGGAKVYGATAGIERNFFGIGATTVFGEWSRGDDVTVSISPLGFAAGPIGRIDVYGLGVVQSINNSALDLYLGYRRVDVGMTDDIDIVMAGARVKF